MLLRRITITPFPLRNIYRSFRGIGSIGGATPLQKTTAVTGPVSPIDRAHQLTMLCCPFARILIYVLTVFCRPLFLNDRLARTTVRSQSISACFRLRKIPLIFMSFTSSALLHDNPAPCICLPNANYTINPNMTRTPNERYIRSLDKSIEWHYNYGIGLNTKGQRQ